MRPRVLVSLLLLLLLALPTGIAHGAKNKRVRLKAFKSCSSLVSYARVQAQRTKLPVTPPQTRPVAPVVSEGGGSDGAGRAPAAAPAPAGDFAAPGEDSSTTNVQEVGVDEPDIVKSDGQRIYAVANGKLQIVDARAAQPKLLASVDLPGGTGTAELLARGNKLLVLGTGYRYQPLPAESGPSGPGTDARAASIIPYQAGATTLSEVDVSNPAAPKVLRSYTVEGNYVSARLTGKTARVVVSASRYSLDYANPVLARPEAVVANAAGQPTARRAAVACRSVRHPVSFSGLGMLTVLTVDLDKGLPAIDSDAIMTDADTIYASTGALYVATQRYDSTPGTVDPGMLTTIHKFDTSDAGQTTYKVSGSVRGYLLNQFSMSEDRGVLRVASTTEPQWGAEGPVRESESAVSVLEERPGNLAAIGRVEGLGKGERIYSVRFIGDKGYVVTFRQVDPLYTLDLANPRDPRVVGELKIAGYSAYLHPIDDNLMIGVGQDANEQGQRQGTQISLFDVSDPANVKRLHNHTLGQFSSSAAETDHHAFLYWPKTALTVVPINQFGGQKPFAGAVGFSVRRGGIAEVGRVEHAPAVNNVTSPIERSLVVGGRLFTMSQRGVMASKLDSLAAEGFAGFASPPPPPPPGPKPVPEAQPAPPQPANPPPPR